MMTLPTPAAKIGAWACWAVPTFAGTADTNLGTGADYGAKLLGDIFSMAPGSQPKTRGLAFIPSLYRDHDARSHAAQRDRGAFVALTGDIDQGDHPLAQIVRLVRTFASDAAALVYSSPHARPGDRRWRIILPLATPIPFSIWFDAQTAFFNFMEGHGVTMDRALARAGQPVYLPNVPSSHLKSGQPLRSAAGDPLYYTRATTGIGAPGLRLTAGTIARALASLGAQRKADESKRERLQVEAQQRRASCPQIAGEPLLDGFKRANALPDMLTAYGYEKSPRNPNDWRSRHQTGETYATRIIGDKWVSLSASDTAAGLGSKCATGCYGDAYDLYVHYEHQGNHKAAFRQIARDQSRMNRSVA